MHLHVKRGTFIKKHASAGAPTFTGGSCWALTHALQVSTEHVISLFLAKRSSIGRHFCCMSHAAVCEQACIPQCLSWTDITYRLARQAGSGSFPRVLIPCNGSVLVAVPCLLLGLHACDGGCGRCAGVLGAPACCSSKSAVRGHRVLAAGGIPLLLPASFFIAVHTSLPMELVSPLPSFLRHSPCFATSHKLLASSSCDAVVLSLFLRHNCLLDHTLSTFQQCCRSSAHLAAASHWTCILASSLASASFSMVYGAAHGIRSHHPPIESQLH